MIAPLLFNTSIKENILYGNENTSKFEGEWKDDKKDIFGIYKSVDGYEYKGWWKDGERRIIYINR